MTGPDGTVRPHYRAFADWLEHTDGARIAQMREEVEASPTTPLQPRHNPG